MTTNERVMAVLRKHSVEIFDGWENLKRLTTGSMGFDEILGGGIPVGRVTQVYGAKSTGKTTFSYLAAAQVTQRKEYVLWVDSEGSYERRWAERMGVDLDYLIIHRPKLAEPAFEAVINLMDENIFKLIVIDSIVGFAFRAVVDAGFDKVPMGGRARSIGTFLTIMRYKLVDSDTAMIVLNQVRANLKPYGGDVTRPGGLQLEHDTDIMVHLLTPYTSPPDPSPTTPVETLTLRPSIKKNRTAPTDGFKAEVTLHVNDEQVINRTADVVAMARRHGLFTNKNGGRLAGSAHPHYDGQDLVYDGDGSEEITGAGSTYLKVQIFLELNPKIEEAIYTRLISISEGAKHAAKSTD